MTLLLIVFLIRIVKYLVSTKKTINEIKKDIETREQRENNIDGEYLKKIKNYLLSYSIVKSKISLYNRALILIYYFPLSLFFIAIPFFLSFLDPKYITAVIGASSSKITKFAWFYNGVYVLYFIILLQSFFKVSDLEVANKPLDLQILGDDYKIGINILSLIFCISYAFITNFADGETIFLIFIISFFVGFVIVYSTHVGNK
ncbi:MAG: hypothetical protein K9W45_02170 [Candidatus Heimdallarchaeum aukensis]|uniref:Uncharacterized protein n=1 Tax=Candidatus Heimdallarchaeum aukensis TaxID=2876573 RepID=A0A9Y1FM62_9ARCH|nr:MAG: hypothetical protein K9W45_02170 [Candidatus Heimdallarchaeum aukensis]